MAALRQRKAAVKKQLQENSAYIRTTTKKMFGPPPQATSKIGSFINLLEQGVAVYDGVMMGMRVVRNLRRIFGKRR